MNENFKISGDKVIFCDFMPESDSERSVNFSYKNHMVTVYDASGKELYAYVAFKEPIRKEVNERFGLHQAIMNRTGKGKEIYSLQY